MKINEKYRKLKERDILYGGKENLSLLCGASTEDNLKVGLMLFADHVAYLTGQLRDRFVGGSQEDNYEDFLCDIDTKEQFMDMGYTEEELHLGSLFGLLTTDSTSLVHRKISMQGKAITECISMMLGMTSQDPGKVFAPFILESSKVYIDKVTAKRGLR